MVHRIKSNTAFIFYFKHPDLDHSVSANIGSDRNTFTALHGGFLSLTHLENKEGMERNNYCLHWYNHVRSIFLTE
jgi:hypothetical protein